MRSDFGASQCGARGCRGSPFGADARHLPHLLRYSLPKSRIQPDRSAPSEADHCSRCSLSNKLVAIIQTTPIGLLLDFHSHSSIAPAMWSQFHDCGSSRHPHPSMAKANEDLAAAR